MNLVGLNVADFIDKLGSDAPAPGGGSASALAGAVGISLTRMVAALTLGKEKYRDQDQLMLEIMQKAEKLPQTCVKKHEPHCYGSYFLVHFRRFFDCFVNTANHVERLFWQIVVFTSHNAFKATDGFFQRHVFAFCASEHFSHVERL